MSRSQDDIVRRVSKDFPGVPIAKILLGAFALVVAGFLLGQTISIECEKVLDSKTGTEVIRLKTSPPLLSFLEKDTPIYLLIVLGIVGYYAWKNWRDYKKQLESE